jgi:hypothetical protein
MTVATREVDAPAPLPRAPRLESGRIIGSVAGPETPGTYRLHARLLGPDGADVDGSAATYEVAVSSGAAAAYEVPSALAVTAGEPVNMPVTVRNDGAAAWGSESIGDAYLVVSWDRGSMLPEIAATLRLDLAPGAPATTSISVLAPHNPGHHLLRVEVVMVEGVRSFPTASLRASCLSRCSDRRSRPFPGTTPTNSVRRCRRSKSRAKFREAPLPIGLRQLRHLVSVQQRS